MAAPAAVSERNAPLRFFKSVLQLQWQAALVPVGFTQYWLSSLATFLLRGFVFLGAPPAEYRNNGKLREAMHTVDHMAQREDVFRKRIRELEAESEARLKDKRKALTKLHKARAELQESQHTEGLTPVDSGALPISPLPDDPTPWKVQVSFFVAAVLPVLWFWSQAETPALSRKVVSCILFPEILMYIWKYFSKPTRALAFETDSINGMDGQTMPG
ncbi:hypothetical protein WJX73_008678 [Symbiochloris irregularis]|uniref:Calcium uniporter protein n=1 Tax=Symbiochloris irregularis TaxID=706552 RepID=A0AAW1P8S6_9CHLO